MSRSGVRTEARGARARGEATRWWQLAAVLTALTAGGTAEAASQVINPTGGTAAADGLRVTILDNTQIQVRRVNQNQLYSPSQPTSGTSPNGSLFNGMYLAIGTTLYGPRSSVAVSNAMPTEFSLVSQSAVAGTGTSASPWTVVTTVGAGGATVRVTTQYVLGDDYFTETVQVTPPPGNTQQLRFYHLIDTYLQGSDRGPGYVLPATGVPTVVGTFQATTVYEEFISGSRPWNDWYTANYATMFTRARMGGALNMTVDTNTNVDNGIGVQWNLGNGTTAQTWDYRVSFRPTPRCVNNTLCSGGTPVCNTATGNCVAAAVALTNPPAGGTATTTNQSAAITGTGVPGQTVTVLEGASTVCTAVVTVGGSWSCTPTTPFTIGSHALTARLGTATSSGTLVVQCGSNMQCASPQICSMGACVTPACTGNFGQGTPRDCASASPVCSNPGTAAAACTACSMGQVYNTSTRVCVAPAVALAVPPAGGSQNTTNRRQPISGTGVPGQTVTVSEAGSTICSATVAMAGTWSCTPGADLSIGAHPLTASSGGASSAGTLVVQCTMNNQCSMGQVCSMGACTTPSCTGNAGAGTARDCPLATPVCNNPGTGMAACAACAAGQVYNTASRACVRPAVSLTAPPTGGSLTTTNTMLPITGTGVPGQTVTVSEAGATVCTAAVANDGRWQCAPGTAWTIGSHPLTASSAGATSSGTLVVQCTMNAQCGGILVCSMGGCVTPACTGNAGAGTARDCPSATPLCNNPGTAGSACSACPMGQVFNPVSRVCVASAVSFTTPPAGGTLTTTNTMQPVAGTGVPGQTVVVREGSATLCMATVQNDSSWTCTPAMALSIGTHVLVASSGTASSSGTVVVRCTADTQCSMGQVCGGGICVTPMCSGNNGAGTAADCPAATPLCSMPGTAGATCTTCPAGQVFNTAAARCEPAAVAFTNPPASGSANTSSQLPVLTGTGVPGQMVTVAEGAAGICTATVNAMGLWQCTPTGALSIGPHMLVATSGGATSMGTLVVQCTMNAQCAMGLVCNAAAGTCVMPACTGSNGTGMGECPTATPVCNNPSTAMAMCAACPAGERYDATLRRCRGCAVATQTMDCVSPATACDPTAMGCVEPMVRVTTPADASTTSNGSPPVSGTATPGQAITVYLDGMAIGTVTADAMGNWSITPSTTLARGSHMASAQLVIGSVATMSNTNTFRVVGCTSPMDCRAPQNICDATTNTCRGCTVATQTTDCSGATTACNASSEQCVAPMVAITAPMDGSTGTERRPSIVGTATPGQTVQVQLDGMSVGTAVADAMGNWTLVLTSDLALGMHTALGRVAIGATNTDSATVRFTVAGCATNAECSGATPICDAMLRICRACATASAAADCPTAMAPFCSTSGATAGTCVAPPPAVVSPANGSTTTSPQPTIRGTGPANTTIEVYLDGMLVGRTMSDSMGNWSFEPTMSLPVGMHTVAAANVLSGLVGPRGAANSFTVAACMTSADCSGNTPVCDAGRMLCRPCNPTTAAMDCPAARPTCETMGPNAGQCVATAPSISLPAEGATLSSRRPDVVGVATPGSTVAVFIDGMEVGRTTADAMGNFTLPTTTDLALGMHTVAAATVDASGAVGTPGRANTFTVVACSATVRCSGGTPVCDATTMQCRPCAPASAAADCPDPAASVCSTSGPTAGRCVPRVPTITAPSNNERTATRRPEIRGMAQPNTTVAVFLDGVEVGRAMTNAMGEFTFALARELTPGTHTAAAAPVDAMGTTGTPGPLVSFTVPECTMDSECGAMLGCDVARGVCVPRDADGGVPPSDGGVLPGDDAGTMGPDAGTVGDDAGAMTSDAGSMGSDAGRMPDGAVAPDGGALYVTGNGACSCRTPGQPVRGPSSGLVLVGLAASAALLRRRRR